MKLYSPHFVGFSLANEHEHMPDWSDWRTLVNRCCILLPPLSAASSVCALFATWLSPSNKLFQGIHICLSPVEIPYLQSLHVFGIPVQRPHPLALEFRKSVCGMLWIFSGIAQWKPVIVFNLPSWEGCGRRHLSVQK